MSRYRHRDWEASYQSSKARLRGMLAANVPKRMIQNEARTLVNAAYGGPWKALYALLRSQLYSAWLHYGLRRWEWIRTRIFRQPQDDAIAAYERANHEVEEVERIASEL